MGNQTQQNNKNLYEKLGVYALATDPIYIGTGGYNIGRVDNTIVRDPITNIPKIPGSSLAGTWRYYVVLEALKDIKDKLKEKIDEIIDVLPIEDDEKNKVRSSKEKLNFNGFNELKKSIYEVLNLTDESKKREIHNQLQDYFKGDFNNESWQFFEGNRFLQITCAGQDNIPQEELENAPFATNKEGKTGHCGHCIVCKGFGFSKRDISWQGMIFFSDLNILFFPVFTYKGTKWITTASKLKEIGIEESAPSDNKIKIKNGNEEYLNLGWLYLEVEDLHSIDENKLSSLNFENFKLKPEDVIIVPESLFSHIVNSNLEVRTSVSIDLITGAAKEGALFTSEAIPRGTIFYGEVRIFDKKGFEDLEPKLKPLPEVNQLEQALNDSKHFYETLGIGGMTTRGFGRLKVEIFSNDKTEDTISNTSENGKSAQQGENNE